MSSIAKTSAVGAIDDFLSVVQELAASLLGTPAFNLDADEPLGSLGFDSASLKLFSIRLSEHFRTPIDTVLLFTYPTLNALSAYIAQNSLGAAQQTQPERSTAKPAGTEADRTRDIAIVGVACRLPGADSKEEFWANQLRTRNCISEVPAHRWDWKALSGDPLRDAGRTDVRWGGFIQGEDLFAPEFFGISVYEAELMDPQHRLFLKTAWEAIWDAGYDPKALAGRSVGVFAGVQFQDYQKLLDQKGRLNAQVLTGSAHAMVANRVSFLLDIHGPSETVDTACSSSLVAVHNAVRAIRNGECDLALAGGVNLLLTPDLFVMGRQLGVLSPTGQCRTFDAGADGYVRAEGVGVLLLKPFDEALSARDHIFGVIKGTAVNHGGKAASLTAPNSSAQAALIVRALRDARLTPNNISYVEMHGTGTELGDPIELEGVKTAFRTLRRERDLKPSPCAIGSVKTNIGHLEPAAGVAGMINVLLALQHRLLPGLSNFRNLNPHLVLEDGFILQKEAGAWPSSATGEPIAALVNSFGFGGANACLAVQQYTPLEYGPNIRRELYVPVAASSPSLIKTYAAALAKFLQNLEHNADADRHLSDIAFTLQRRNDNRSVRAVARASSRSELLRGLEAIASGRTPIENVATSESTEMSEWPAHVLQWLHGGPTDWPDIADARSTPLPISPWPDRSCWFEPRPAAQPDVEIDQPAEMIYLQPAWRAAAGGPRRRLDGKCIWLIGRNREQVASFISVLKSALPAEARLITSLIVAAASPPCPSLEDWIRTGAQPDLVAVLPAEEDGSKQSGDEVRVLFSLTKQLMERSFNRPVDVFYVAPGDFGASPWDDALPALAKSAFLENERLHLHTLYFSDKSGPDWRRLLTLEMTAEASKAPLSVRFGPSRLVRELQLATIAPPANQQGAWFREGGVYLVPGGAGELGYRLLEALLEDIDATFVVLGRSPCADGINDRINFLQKKAKQSDRVKYVQCDIADLTTTHAAVAGVIRRHGRLDGIVNLVTAHKDAYLYNKRWEDFSAVIASKVQGSINLDLVTAGLELDFFVAFSSLASLGFAGGADYAYGCAFQNAFANWRNQETAAGRRRGISYAVSWSRWQWDKYVTAAVDDWFVSLGYAYMNAETGADALRCVMAQPVADILAIHGRRDRIFKHLDLSTGLLETRRGDVAATAVRVNASQHHRGFAELGEGATAIGTQSGSQSVLESGMAVENSHIHNGDLESGLSAIICELLKLDKLDPHTSLPSVGLDSVMAIRLIVLIERRLSRSLSPKELLRHQSAAELAAYLRSRDILAGSDAGLERDISAIICELLKLDKLDPRASLPSVGLDSVMAIRLIVLIEQRLSRSLSPKELLRHQSVAELAAYLRSVEMSPALTTSGVGR